MNAIAGNPRAVAQAFGLKRHHIYKMIRSGAVKSHALGRRSVVFYADVEKALRDLPPTKRPHHAEQAHA